MQDYQTMSNMWLTSNFFSLEKSMGKDNEIGSKNKDHSQVIELEMNEIVMEINGWWIYTLQDIKERIKKIKE